MLTVEDLLHVLLYAAATAGCWQQDSARDFKCGSDLPSWGKAAGIWPRLATNRRWYEPADAGSLGVDFLLYERVSRLACDVRVTRLAARFLGFLVWTHGLRTIGPVKATSPVCSGSVEHASATFVGKLQTRWAKESAISALRSNLAELVASQGGVMSLAEVVEALLIARAHHMKSRSVAACTGGRNAAIEVERTMAEPRLFVRREKADCSLLIAASLELASYAQRLGAVADQLAAADPLMVQARVLERLREVPSPAGADFADTRLVRLAAAASKNA